MKGRFLTLSLIACGAVLVATTHVLSKEGYAVALITLVTVIVAAALGVQIETLVRNERRRTRQIRELDLRAHELKVTAEDLVNGVAERHDADELKPLLQRKPGRHERLGLLLDEVGFELSMRIIRDAARVKATLTRASKPQSL